MAKPSAVPTWATDTNLASGPQSGQTTKLEPSAGIKAQGAVPGFSAPGRWRNWLDNMFCQWCAYLNNLENETAFLTANFTWSGVHLFTSSAGTLIAKILLAGSGLGEIFYTDNAGVAAPRARKMLLPLVTDGFWFRNVTVTNGWTGTDLANQPLRLAIVLPRGCVITKVEACALKGGAGGTGWKLDVYKFARAVNVPSVATQLGSTATSGTSATTSTQDSGTLAETVDNDANAYEAIVTSSSTAASSQDRLNWVLVYFNDPGPRNG
jgi:hypothetical protein